MSDAEAFITGEGTELEPRPPGGALDLLDLPADRLRPSGPPPGFGELRFTLPQALGDALRAFVQREGVSLAAVLRASFQVLLGRLTGRLAGDLTCRRLLAWAKAGFEPGEALPAPLFDTLRFAASEVDGALDCRFDYARDLFDASTVARWAGYLERIVAGFLDHPDLRLAGLPLLSAAERFQLAVEWSGAPAPYPRESALPDLFHREAARRPDAVALDSPGLELTYGELENRSRALAARLVTLGVRLESPVAVLLPQSPALVVAMLAILEAGGAYVPLAPGLPDERLAFLLADTGAPVLLTESRYADRVPAAAPRVLLLDAPAGAPSAVPALPAVAPESLALVLYTSGSTGVPKGVAIPHRGVVRLVREADYARLTAGDRVAQIANPAFDAITFEVWGALLNGARLVLIDREAALSPARLAADLHRHGVTALLLTTALFHQVAAVAPEAFAGLDLLLFGGEAADPTAARRVLAAGVRARLLNVYGPTEGTTIATWFPVAELGQEATTVPIGHPIANTSVHVVDGGLELSPIGVPGELWIGGDGLARGYLGRPDLTAERFLPDPFRGAEATGERLYRTGDRVRRRADGALLFLGRSDGQVKIRGFRIEPGEIEVHLASHPAVRESAVLALPAGERGPRLVACASLVPGGEATAADLRAHLAGRLPEHMVPAAFLLVDALPKNANGKVDRHALAALAIAPSAEGGTPRGREPGTPAEELLAGVWSELLGESRLGEADDFFALGGHSLLATQLASRVRDLFRVELPVDRIFANPTLGALAAAVTAELQGESAVTAVTAPPLRPVPRGAPLPLSFAQERLWFLDRLMAGSAAYNLPAALTMRGHLSVPALAAALAALVERHEPLRTTFLAQGGQPFQVIAPRGALALPVVDLRGLGSAEREREARDLRRREARRPFDLAAGPVLRATLLALATGEEEEHLLLLTLHHIAGDGWSVDIFFRELAAFYAAAGAGRSPSLPALSVQYADFAVWQRAWLSGAVLERQLGWWRERLAGVPAQLDLPLDRPRSATAKRRAAVVLLPLGGNLPRDLAALSRRSGATRFMTLLAGFGALLHRLTGEERPVVGSPVANRTRTELEGLVGMFVNTLAFVGDLRGSPGFSTLLTRVREMALGAYAHQDLPFERLVEALASGGAGRQAGSSPLFQVMLVLQNARLPSFELPGLTLAAEALATGSAKFDLTLSFGEAQGGLSGALEYDADLLDRTTVERWAEGLRTLLEEAVAAPARPLSEIPLLDLAERRETQASRVPRVPKAAADEAALLDARLSARQEKVAGLRSSLSDRKRALLEKMVAGRTGAAPRPEPAIPRRREPGPAVLSFAQERLWFLDRLQPESPAYNIPMGLRLAGHLDLPALARSLGEIVRRHEALRTTFVVLPGSGEPRQVVAPYRPLALPVVDLEPLPAAKREAEAERLAAAESLRPFDLARGPLLRATLVRLSATDGLALFNLHHIVGDGWSTGVLVGELAKLYGAFVAGRGSPLPELPIQYADFATWQREWLAGEALEAELAHWRRELSGAPDLLELPTDRPRPLVASSRGDQLRFALPRALAAGLGALAERLGATLFMVLLAGFQALLGRLTGQEDLLVGSAVANRTHRENEPLIGFFVNLLALRGRLAGAPSFRDLVARARATALNAFAHQDLPFEKLIAELRLARSGSRSPLVQASLVLQNVPRGALELPGLTLRPVETPTTTAKFELGLTVMEAGGELLCQLEYATDLFDATTVRRWASHFEALLAAGAANPGVPLEGLPLLPETELHQLLREWNDAAVRYPEGGCLEDWIAAQAARAPDAVALVFADETGTSAMTYGGLDARAERLGERLRRLWVGPEGTVGICLERSLDLLVGLLGILKAGGAYLPLDPEYPRERLANMLEDAGAPVVLSVRRLADLLPEHPGVNLYLDEEGGSLPPGRGTVGTGGRLGGGPFAARPALPGNLAYVIFTSGSTGRPKGAMNTHGAILNRLAWMQEAYGLTPSDRVLQKTPISFDVSVWELFWPLLRGACLVIARPGEHREPALLARTIATQEVTVLHFVPPMLQAFLEEPAAGRCSSLRAVMASGEALPPATAERFFSRLPGAALHNLYGPTEAAVDVTAWACRPGSGGASVPLGRPIANTAIHILDRGFRPTPIGVPGELAIGGVQLARGYRNRPDLTALRFVPDPSSDRPGARLYRSGDLARHLGNGNLEYLGRLDTQVKIRGFRIELGEIEAVLAAHPEVSQAAVLVREDREGNRRLVAYVVGGASEDLPRYLRERLPDSMVPAAIVSLPALPLTVNGKLDRGALPAPEWGSAADYVPPGTPFEEMLAAIWEDLLGVPRVGTGDDFFALGGHSLLATRLVSLMRERFGVELPVRAVFDAPTVAGLARLLASGSAGASVPPLQPAARDGELPLSFAQERLWFLDRLEPGGSAYNIGAAVRLTGLLDVAAFAAALGEVVRRHEALRTGFREGSSGAPVQVIAAWRPSRLAVSDLSALSGGPGEARAGEVFRLAREEAGRPFDLAQGRPLRSALLRLAADEHVLLLTVHHIAADGWSVGVLVRELAALYGAFREGRPSFLPELPVQYADFAVWQRSWLSGEVLAAQTAHWRRVLSGAPALELPADRPRPAQRSPRGALREVALSPGLSSSLQRLARGAGATAFMVLLAGFEALLGRLSGQEDLLVGSPIANRRHREIEGLIGFFVNTLVLRADLAGDPGFRILLGRTREVTLSAYAHQDLPFEKLVEELAPVRDPSRTPLFQVAFTFGNAAPAAPEFHGLAAEWLRPVGETAKFDLTLALASRGESPMAGAIEYSTDLFDAPTVARLAGQLATLLSEAVAAPERPIGELPLLSPPERAALWAEWNDTAVESREGAEESAPRAFELQAQRIPDAVAVSAPEGLLSYGELARRSGRLAGRLRALGVGPEVPVAICADRSAALVIGALAVLRAGGAYVPLDPAAPDERLALLLADVQAGIASPVALVDRKIRERLSAGRGSLPASLLDLDEEHRRTGEGGRDLPAAILPGSRAYVIYTSGSTGMPKGVEVEHGSLANLVRWHLATCGVGPGNRLTQIASPAFDATMLEIWPCLAAGACLAVPPEEVRADPARLVPWLAAESVSVAFLPTPLAEAALAEDWPAGVALRALLTGGDRLHRRPGLGLPFRLLNIYGPTESTVVTTCAPVPPAPEGVLPPIGRPIANTRVHLRDRRGEPVPAGVPGELWIGGSGLARGYLHRPDQTAERFLPDPLGAPGARLYRTGDLVRRLPAGELEFLGRLDHQVKVRGFRIELGEIEAALAAHPGVREAAVVARETARDLSGDRQLVAYVVPAGAGAGDGDGDGDGDGRELLAELPGALAARLPYYMVPAAFIALPALPLTANGKVDRRALPDPASGRGGEEPVAARTPAEELLADLWAALLGVERVGQDDDFFALGGHSLLATKLIARVREIFGVELPVRAVFDQPTVAGLARLLASGSGGAPAPPPLRPAARDGELPLSFAQERLWFLDRLEPGGSAYNIGAAVRLTGPLGVAAFAAALGEVVRRHEALRTGFREGASGAPVQVIAASLPLPVAVADLSALSAGPGGAREGEVFRLAREEAGRPFDLTQGRPLRSALLRLAPAEHVLLLTVHHIAADGGSVGVLVRELAALYGAFLSGEASPLPELPIQYADFAVWQRSWLSGEALTAQTAYWRQALAGAAVLELPTDRPRPALRTSRGAQREVALSPGLSSALKRLARGEGATAFMVLLAGFEALLGRLSGQEDLLVGSPIANRRHREIEGLIGFFVNTLVLRADLAGDPDFRTLVSRTREVTLAAYAHQDLPFEKLVEELAPVRDPSRTPLFQVMFTLQNTGSAAPEFHGLTAEWLTPPVETAKFDLTLTLGSGGEAPFAGPLEFSADLFDAPTAIRLGRQLETLLAAATAAPDRPLSHLPLLTAAERHQLEVEWNALEAPARPDRPERATLFARFAAQAARTPDAVALVAGESRLTYGELATRAERIGRRLRAAGQGPGARVGLSLERSPELVASLYGILAAGATYVPVDPTYPPERRDFMLRDAGLAAVIDGAWLAGPEEPARGDLDTAGPSLSGHVYAIYTSGSTGQPKGAVVYQGAFSNLVDWYIEELGLAAADRLLLLSSASFDLTQKNFFAPLLTGAELHLAPVLYDPAELLTLVERHGITGLNCTPSAFYPLAEEGDPAALASLRSVVLGGEPIAAGRLDRWRRSAGCRAAVLNSYGPTECTDVVAFHRLAPPDSPEAGRAVPLGRPIPGVRLSIAGTGPEPAPIGIPGELWIGGLSVGGGYLGDPARTAEKFLPDPRAGLLGNAPGACAYRTGDLARLLPGGEIEYLGRIDHQVKVRGHRVELGEIEAALAACSRVREAAVVAREMPDRPGDLRLVAYLVAAEGALGKPDLAGRLREELASRLPPYMMPAAFVVLAVLPLTPSGKVDRRALPAPGEAADGAGGPEPAAPRSPVEELLAGIWCELLVVERVRPADDFFALGGHSLLATQLVSRVRAAFGVEVPLRRIFEAPTLGAMAAEIAALHRGEPGGEPPLLPVERGPRAPLSFAQERLWFLDRFEPGNASLNIPLAVELSGRLAVPALREALALLADRHELLRTTFEEVAGEPSQRVHAALPVALPEIDLGALPPAAAQGEADRLGAEQALCGFDLERGPLYRTELVRLAPGHHRFLLVLHHAIADGWSLAILLRELGELYAALTQGRPPALPPLPIQYADFAVWQRRLLAAEGRADLEYWLERLGGEIEPLELPADRPRPAIQSFRGGSWPLVLPADLALRLRAFGRRAGATLFMTLLSAAKALLKRQSGQDDVLFGTPIAGRRRLETEGLIGCFLNTLVLRTDLSGRPGFRALVERVREVTLEAYARQDVPFEAVLAGLKGERDLSRTPLFQVFFNLLNMPRGELRLPELTLAPVAGPEAVPSKFDLTFYISEEGREIVLDLVYNADLFDAARIADLADQYAGLLAQAVELPELPLASFSLVTERARAVLPDPRAELGAAWVGAVHEIFAGHARQSPDRVALVDGRGTWTYGELDTVADRLAAWLGAHGVAREDRVAIYAHRSAPLVPALLATLKAGAAFTLLDPVYPAARLLDMLGQVSPKACLLLGEAGPLPGAVAAWLNAVSCPRLTLPGGGPGALLAGISGTADLPAAPPAVAVGPDDLAYVAFTSGSTGSPKGILGRHGPLTHFLPFLTERFGLSAEDRFTLLSGLAHDPLQRDVFTPLCLGATLVIPDASEIPVAGRIAAWLAREGATVAHLTPAMAQLLTEPPAGGEAARVASLRLVLLVGEALTRRDVARLARLAPRVTTVNLFGSTETQRAVGYHVATAEEAAEGGRGQQVLPLGRGMDDVQLLVLTSEGGLAGIAGIGEVGEIAVRSPHLARGYLNDPALTAARFQLNPATGAIGATGVIGAIGAGGDRLYRTGDLGRYLPDGEVTFAGRGDLQVKIRGFRVEPAEIEAALARHPAVASAAVLLQEERGERFLVALVVPRPGAEPASAELRAHLLSELPSYMVPQAFARLSALPLTPTGKLDRRALPRLVPPLSQLMDAALGAGYAAPRDPTEELLADVWARLLGRDRIGVHDSFFTLGGHSLLATRLVSQIREVFGVEVPLRALFDTPTVAEIAPLLTAGTGEALPPPLLPAPRVGTEPELPLSFAQERLWILDRLAPGEAAYNLSAAVRLAGPLDAAALGAALGEVVRRHEALRTRFREGESGEPVQAIAPWSAPGFPRVDLAALPERERGEAARRLAREEAGRPFDLASGRLVRATLLRLGTAGEGEHLALLTLHHIAADGWSLGLLVSELAALYGAFRAGRPSPLPELPVQYADFAVWQRAWLAGAALETQMAYWRQALAGAPNLDLPTDRPRPPVRSSRGARLRAALPPGLAEEVRRFAREQGATPFMVLFAAFGTLLGRWSGQEDLLVGSPIANRRHREVFGLIGFFVNTLVLRADLSGEPDFSTVLGRARETALGAYAHQDLPFEKLVGELSPARDVSRTPLFQVMLNLQTAAAPAVSGTAAPGFPDLAAERLEVPGQTAQFDLSLILSGGEDGSFAGSVEYSTDLFDAATVARLCRHLETLLAATVADPRARIAGLPLLTAPERQALREWNATAAPDPDGDRCLHEIFLAQAREAPDRTALASEGHALTYGELAARAGLLARHLRRLGVGPEVTVGICLERSPDLLVSLVGVLAAGGAYLPLDPSYPRERLAHMLEDGRPPVVLAAADTAALLPPHPGETLLLSPPLPPLPPLPEPEGAARATAESLAYVIFTSGSTGRPKGVMIRHRSIVNRVLWTLGEFPMTPADRVLQKTPFSFDASIWEIFAPLFRGATLVLARPGGHQDSAYLASALALHGITVLQLVPSLLRVLLDEPAMAAAASLRRLFCGGEALGSDLVERCHDLLPATAITNLYGPTEVAIDATFWRCERGRPAAAIPIGRPIANDQVHVVDARGEVVPAGVSGELRIGGVGLARGYRDRPDLSAERFVPSPWGNGERLYRTGDLVRRLPGGEIEYLGRSDHQVKIRGFRIEMGEIEAALLSDPAVRQAVVVARPLHPDRPGDLRLVAYVVQGGVPKAPADLRAALAKRLPYFMLPAAVVVLPALPLTPNGKVDRRALAVAERPPAEREAAYEAPQEGVEERLAAVWLEVLKDRIGPDGRIGRHDNFFALGGDSLLAIRIVTRARETGLVFTVLQLFERQTLAELARLPQILGEPAASAPEPPPEVPAEGGPDLSGADFDPDDLARFLADLTGG